MSPANLRNETVLQRGGTGASFGQKKSLIRNGCHRCGGGDRQPTHVLKCAIKKNAALRRLRSQTTQTCVRRNCGCAIAILSNMPARGMAATCGCAQHDAGPARTFLEGDGFIRGGNSILTRSTPRAAQRFTWTQPGSAAGEWFAPAQFHPNCFQAALLDCGWRMERYYQVLARCPRDERT